MREKLFTILEFIVSLCIFGDARTWTLNFKTTRMNALHTSSLVNHLFHWLVWCLVLNNVRFKFKTFVLVWVFNQQLNGQSAFHDFVCFSISSILVRFLLCDCVPFGVWDIRESWNQERENPRICSRAKISNFWSPRLQREKTVCARTWSASRAGQRGI